MPRTESAGESLSAEESALLDADRAAEHEAPVEEAASEAAAAAEAPVAAAEAAPEAEVDAEATPEANEKKALAAERERRKASEKREREATENFAKLSGRVEVLNQLFQQQPQAAHPQQPQIEIPDVEADPVGHFKARAELQERLLVEMATAMQQGQRQSEAQNNVNRLLSITSAQAAEYTKENPEYPKAAQYVVESRHKELAALGYADPAMREQIILNDIATIAATLLNAGQNIPRGVEEFARARGWSPASQEAAAQIVAAPQVAPQQQIADAATKLQNIAKGQEAGASLGQVNGGSPNNQVTAERLLKMSDAEFEAATKDPGKWRELMESAPRS